MARIDWVEERLQNWARWKLMQGSGALGFARVNLERVTADTQAEARIPTNDVEAAETEAAIVLLHPPGLVLTVREFYTGTGGIADKSRRLCCGVATIYSRLDQAHRQLADHFLERQRKAKVERERVERLQHSIRPQGSTP